MPRSETIVVRSPSGHDEQSTVEWSDGGITREEVPPGQAAAPYDGSSAGHATRVGEVCHGGGALAMLEVKSGRPGTTARVAVPSTP